MDFLRFLWIFLFIIHSSLSKNLELNNDEEQITEFDETNEIFVSAEAGFQILITVVHVNITKEAQYILVKSGSNMDDGLDGIIFMGFIKEPRQYLSLQNKVYITCKVIEQKPDNTVKLGEKSLDIVHNLFDEVETEDSTCEEFIIKVSRFGEGTTTTETPTTEIPWPTPSYDESDSITVNLTGPPAEWYTQSNLDSLRDNIAEMAKYYCSINNINGEISITNVLIDTIVQCPMNWPNRYDCVQITFRLPIIRENEDDYQLNAEHLQQMWTQYSQKYLDSTYFTNYEIPESTVFTLWLIIICVIILLFSVVLYLFKRFKQRLTGINKRKKSINNNTDQENMIDTQASRNDSLHPHPKQVVPVMFESESAYYEPY